MIHYISDNFLQVEENPKNRKKTKFLLQSHHGEAQQTPERNANLEIKLRQHSLFISSVMKRKYSHRTTEPMGLEWTFKAFLAQPPCNEQKHLQLDQVVQQ